MASRKPQITETEVVGLDLFDALMDRHDEVSESELVAEVIGAGRDSKRRYRGKVRTRVYQRDGGKCFYCNAVVVIERAQIDHVIPWSRGGRTVEMNGVTSCAPCNRKKSNKVW